MTLCDRCQSLDLNGALRRIRNNETQDPVAWDLQPRGPSHFINDWHANLLTVGDASRSCELCTLVMKGWREDRKEVVKERLASGDLFTVPEDIHDDILDIEKYRLASVSLWVEKVAQIEGFGELENNKSRALAFVCVALHGAFKASFDHTCNLMATFRITTSASPQEEEDGISGINIDPSSSQTIGIARRWLDACVRDHERCAQVLGTLDLPTRLLDVGEDLTSPSVVLCELSDFSGPQDGFVALSHCWGIGQNFCTTRSNLEAHKAEILISQLPRTFKDAITVVRGLGLRYLWIDSLCIVQDDPEDWQQEAAKMASVYGNAHVVIAAARGSSDAEGFLGLRPPYDSVSLSPETKSPGSPAVELALHLRLPESRSWTTLGVDAAVSEEPLGRRAWVLQERYLARRTLLYGSEQLFWECAEMGASEEGEKKRLDGTRLAKIRKTANVSDTVQQRASRDPEVGNANVNYKDWYEMIEDYSRRAITKHSDRLPALSGLAKATAASSRDEYLAGLWKTGLIEGLAWCKGQDTQTLAQPTEFVAPSWSWASIFGPVDFPLYKWVDRTLWLSNLGDFEPLATYGDHQLNLGGADSHGQLTGGWLKIKVGVLWPITSITAQQEEPPRVIYYWVQEAGRSPYTDKCIGVKFEHWSQDIEFWMDGGFDLENPASAETGGRELFVLFLARWPLLADGAFIEHRFGLIIEKLGGDRYRRVGFVDGQVLRKVYSPSKREELRRAGDADAETLGIAAYLRAGKSGDWEEEGIRRNDFAYDPLPQLVGGEGTDVTLV